MSSPLLDLVGVGSPIMDVFAPVPDTFLTHVHGEKGGMVLVDNAEIERLLALLPTAPASSTGGSSANTTLNATRLGLRTAFVGKLGNDEAARTYRDRFVSLGVDGSRFKRGDTANARCLALITPDAQRTMRTCLGAAMTLSPSEISPADFAGARHAHIEGYLVFNEALATAVVTSAKAAGCTVSLDLASFEVAAAARAWLLRMLGHGLDVVFANEDEIRALFESSEPYDVLARRLAGFGCTAAVKLGKDGAWVAKGDELHRIDPVRVPDVVDTNGAGDSWAAGFLTGLLRGAPLPTCGRMASVIGAETVRHMGPIIPDAAWPAARDRALALLGG